MFELAPLSSDLRHIAMVRDKSTVVAKTTVRPFEHEEDTMAVLAEQPIGIYTEAFWIGKQLAVVPEVEYVIASRNGNELHFWTIVNCFKNDVRRRIYALEGEVIDRYLDLSFDFHVLPPEAAADFDVNAAGTKLVYMRGG